VSPQQVGGGSDRQEGWVGTVLAAGLLLQMSYSLTAAVPLHWEDDCGANA